MTGKLMQREACIIAGRKFGDSLGLLKNRDRAYDPELQIVHLEKDGTEIAAVLDLDTGYIEGVNEHGIAIVNTTLMVVRDEQEGVKKEKVNGQKGPKRSKDGPKIFRALGADTLEEAVESLVSYAGGIRGHTFVTDGKRLVCIECTRTNPARVYELDPERVNTRTNHGVNYPDAGYTHGDDYVSSIVRRWEAQKRLQDVNRLEAAGPMLMGAIHDSKSPFNPVRATDKMRTTSQLAIDATHPALYLYLIPDHVTLKPTRNLLPEGRKPKIPVRVFKYRDKIEDRIELKKKAKGRYKSKKKVKTKDGDEMVVYEYSERQVADRNRHKAERIEKLRHSMEKLRTKVRKDIKSKNEKIRDVALAIGLMDETFERVGNEGSAKDGHFGVTTWRVKHLKFGKGGVTISYVGKSGVDQKKKITNPRIVAALKAVCKDKNPNDGVLSVKASDVNEYLRHMGITAKDIRGFHANTEMKAQLRKVRKGKLPSDPKAKEKKLKDEFKAALEETAKIVGHEPSTLRSQYLVPGLEKDYVKDGTVNESHTKKGAEAVTDTAELYVIAPEALHHMLRDTDWMELAESLWPGQGRPPVGSTGALWDKMQTEVRESGGAVISTGMDGGYDVGIKGRYNDDGTVEPFDLPVREKGALPPYGLRQAAEHGTPTERRILANALHAPTLVIRDREWWLRKAPNIYRMAREFERVTPEIAGIKFPDDIFTVLWYEDADGKRIAEEAPHDKLYRPAGAKYQRSKFPAYLHETILALNEDGTSSEVLKGEAGWPKDLVTAMVRSGDWDVGDAIMAAGQSCERCMNVLGDHYKVGWGYPFGSDPYWETGTSCDLCDHVPEEDDRRGNEDEQDGPDHLATKTEGEKEDEKVQKMLRKEPKKKPPRYDLRDNRTLDEEEEENLGGGDNGDRDLSMKWNKVGLERRVAFRWLALFQGISPMRVAFRRLAETAPPKQPQQPPQGGGQKPPTFDEWVKDKRWPSKAENAPPGAEVGFEGLKKQDPRKAEQVRAEFKRQFPNAEEEGGKKKDKGEEEPKERTIEDINAELEEARNDLDEAEDAIDEIQTQIKDSKGLIKKMKELLDNMPETAAQNRIDEVNDKIKDERKKIHELEDDLEEAQDDRKAAQDRVKDLKAERKDPGGKKREEKKQKKQEHKEQVRKAIQRVQKAMHSLVGKDAKWARDLEDQLGAQLEDFDEHDAEQFALNFEHKLNELIEGGPQSAEAVNAANGAAKMGFSVEGLTDPEQLGNRLAQITFARNVVGNPLIVGGTPVGQTEMDDKATAKRARQAFEQFQKLNRILREEAAQTIQQELRGLHPETHKAQELEAILTGINTAQVIDTGDSLPGRPQPSKGVAALVREMVKGGDIDQVFAPSKDIFSDEAQKAFEGALGAMTDEELVDFVVGQDKDHPYAPLKEIVETWEGQPETKDFIKNFLREDFMQDIWADRAMRDVMQGNNIPEADDPEVRAKLTEEAKRGNGKRREAVIQAMIRVHDAQERGEEPDPKDVEMARGIDPEEGTVLRENAGSILDKLKDFGKMVMSPAVAVLQHFRNTGDADAKKTETEPHPDEKAKQPRPKAEREQAQEQRGVSPEVQKALSEVAEMKPSGEKERKIEEFVQQQKEMHGLSDEKVKALRRQVTENLADPAEYVRWERDWEEHKRENKGPGKGPEGPGEGAPAFRDDDEATADALAVPYEQSDEIKRRLRENPEFARRMKQLEKGFQIGFGRRWDNPRERAKILKRMREDADYRARIVQKARQLIGEKPDEPEGPEEPKGGPETPKFPGGGGYPTRPPESPEEEARKPGEVWHTKNGWYRKDKNGRISGPYESQEDARQGGKTPPESKPVKRVTLPKETEEERQRREEDEPQLMQRRLASEWMTRLRRIHPDDPNRPIIVIDAA